LDIRRTGSIRQGSEVRGCHEARDRGRVRDDHRRNGERRQPSPERRHHAGSQRRQRLSHNGPQRLRAAGRLGQLQRRGTRTRTQTAVRGGP
ncbi:hypothetical protein M9458_023231, partial [Cirrhinus mrigala]